MFVSSIAMFYCHCKIEFQKFNFWRQVVSALVTRMARAIIPILHRSTLILSQRVILAGQLRATNIAYVDLRTDSL